MFVAISVAAMSDVPPSSPGSRPGVMMTGHEVGAALGVAVLTAVAGDLTTRTGLIDAYPTRLHRSRGRMVALSVVRRLAVPSVQRPQAAATGTDTACTDPHPKGRRGRERTPPPAPLFAPPSDRRWNPVISPARAHRPRRDGGPSQPHRPPTTEAGPR